MNHSISVRNQINAQRSTGPKTEQGKQRSSLNALRHGLTGQTIVLPTDDLEAYRRHMESFTDEYRPQGPTESHLVQTLAETAWRQARVAALETNLLTLGMIRTPKQIDPDRQQLQQALATAASLDSQTRALSNLSLHGQRLARQFEKTLALLKEIQSQRQIEKTVKPAQTQASKDQPQPKAATGFVFSEVPAEPQNNPIEERKFKKAAH